MAFLQRLPPFAIFQIPTYGFLNAAFEGLVCPPTKLCFQLGGVDRITPVVARPIDHELNQPLMRRILRAQLIEHLTNALHHLEVGPLVPSADIIAFPNPALR